MIQQNMDAQADEILSVFKWGPHFFTINEWDDDTSS